MRILELTLDRYPEVLELMQRTPGIGVREADSPAAVAHYLARNPGLSFVAESEGKIIGCALCGHDGRRGYLQHVVVDAPYRRRGIAQQLVERCLEQLAAHGIEKIHLDAFTSNLAAQAYWQKRGWQRRDDLVRFSLTRSLHPNA